MRYAVDLTTPEAVARQLNTVNPSGGVPLIIQDKATGRYLNFWEFATEMCQAASEIITQETGRSFVPFRSAYDIVYADIARDMRRGRLPLPDDLLMPSSLAFGDLAISTDDYRVFPSSSTPISALYLSSTAMTGASYGFGAGYLVDGLWGYVTDLGQAWTQVQSSLSIGSTSTTEITVSLDTADRYETLQYLKIEDEFMQITAIDLDTDVLTVRRGVNGTTSAIHSSVPLYRFNVKRDIAKAATELACHFYIKRTPAGNAVMMPDGSVSLDTYPATVTKIIKQYQRMTLASTSSPVYYPR